MIKNDFYGNNFIWWTGIVEDRDDPLKIGRVRVRIFGLHSQDNTKAPKENLPWAQIMMPTTGTQAFFGPRPGDWVMGFFQDGANAQLPVVIGTYSGLDSSQSIAYTATEPATIRPNPVPDTVIRNNQEPFIPRTARGIVWGTPVQRTNLRRAHVCDVSAKMKAFIGKIRAAFGTVIEAIRTVIRALLAALGLLPDGGLIRNVIQQIKKVLAFIRYIRKILQELIDIKNAFLALILKIRNMIAFILALPSRLLRFLKQCLSEFLNELKGEFAEMLGGVLAETGIGEVINGVREISREIQLASDQIAELSRTPDQLQNILRTPPTEFDLQDGARTTLDLLQSNRTAITGTTNSSSQIYDTLTDVIGAVSTNPTTGVINQTDGRFLTRVRTAFETVTTTVRSTEPNTNNIDTSVNKSVTTNIDGRNIQTVPSGPTVMPANFLTNATTSINNLTKARSLGASITNDLEKVSNSLPSPTEVNTKYGADGFVNPPSP